MEFGIKGCAGFDGGRKWWKNKMEFKLSVIGLLIRPWNMIVGLVRVYCQKVPKNGKYKNVKEKKSKKENKNTVQET